MALRPEDTGTETDMYTPLTTGFRYRKSEDVSGFEIRRELLDAVAVRIEQLDKMTAAHPEFSRNLIIRGVIEEADASL